jgi:uncharacterized membrane protein YbhN (UPF0104 family)
MRSTSLKFAAKLILTILLLGFVLRSVDPVVFWETIRSVDVRLLSLAILMFYPVQLLAAYRWYFLLKRFARSLPFWSVVRHNMLGQFAALFLPGQISGDVVRTIAVANGQSGRATFVLSVMIDKAALLAATAVFALIGTLGSRLQSQFAGAYLVALGLLMIALSAVFLLSRYRGDHVTRWLISLGNKLPAHLQPSLLRIGADLDVPQIPFYTTLMVLILAFGLQLAYTAGSFMTARAMHITISLVDWAAINAVVSIVRVLPLTIGGLGIREGLFASVLALYGVPAAQAIAFSLTSFVIVAVLTSLGWFVLDSLHMGRFQAHHHPSWGTKSAQPARHGLSNSGSSGKRGS